MKKNTAILTFLFFFMICSACQANNPEGGVASSYEEDVSSNFRHKKVVMILVDSMTGDLVEEGVQSGKMPALKYLVEQGKHFDEVVAPFPTMSVTIESTLVTGKMADEHKVPGLSWYDQTQDKLINYGTSLPFLWKNGFAEAVYDAIYSLNNEHLSANVSTIFEELDKHQLSSGAVNTLVYRGNYDHQLTMPSISDKLLRLPEQLSTKGPNLLAFGALTHPEILQEDNFDDYIWERFGLRDQYSMQVTEALIKENKQPDFLMVYLPDFDKIAHEYGPGYTEGFIELDQYFQGILSAYGSWEKAVNENIFIIVGDHGSDKQRSTEEVISINLDNLYAEYKVAPLGEKVSIGEIAFGVNQRMAYIYDVHDQGILPRLAARARLDERIALAAWQDGEWTVVNHPESDTTLRFKKGGIWQDKYAQNWSIVGNEAILDLHVEEEKKRINYTDYPDALHQIYSSLHSHASSKMLVVAKPGHNFRSEGIPVHPDGGEHGGLHQNDTLTSLLIAGTEQYPEKLRLVDLKEYLLQLLTSSPEPIIGKDMRNKQIKKASYINKQLAEEAKHEVKNIAGVIDVVSVAIDDDIFMALEVKQWHKFRLPSIRKEAFHLLKHLHDGKVVHVTTDWKVTRELRKLEQSMKDEAITATEARQKLRQLEKNMKG